MVDSLIVISGAGPGLPLQALVSGASITADVLLSNSTSDGAYSSLQVPYSDGK